MKGQTMQAYNKHYFRYEALDKNLENPIDITYYVEDGGTVSYNALTRLKASCSLKVVVPTSETLELEAIRIYSILNDHEECIGTFYNKTPSSSFNGEIQEIEPTCYSTLIRISSNSPDGRYYVPKGTNAIAEVKRILERLGYGYDIPNCTKTTSTDKEFELGTYYLDIINYLLDVVNYTSLYVDVYGNYISKPYILPQDRMPDIILDEDEIDNVIEPMQNNLLDTLNIPNKFIRYCNSDPTLDLYAVYENTEGITGTRHTWVNTDCQEVQDAADYDTLYDQCKKACAEATSIYNKVEMSTGLQILPPYMPIVQLNHYQAQGKYTCTSFEISLTTGGSTNLSMRKVVIV